MFWWAQVETTSHTLFYPLYVLPNQTAEKCFHSSISLYNFETNRNNRTTSTKCQYHLVQSQCETPWLDDQDIGKYHIPHMIENRLKNTYNHMKTMKASC